jgi:membrane protein implicated in regulation of membrane protease activity
VDVLRETQWLLWVGGALVLGLVEVASLDLVFAMLVVGALAAAGVALAGGSFVVQVLVFAGTSGLLLAVVRPIAVRRLRAATPTQRTNVDAQVGRRAEVVTTVTDRGGQVKLSGEVWSARSHLDGQSYPPGMIVNVLAIDGATALVGPRSTGDAASQEHPHPEPEPS